MKFSIVIPETFPNEMRWIIGVIFREFLDIDCEITEGDQDYYCMEFAGSSLHLPDCFFSQANKAWLQPSTLPNSPLTTWDIALSGLNIPLITQPLPVMFGKTEFNIAENNLRFGLDIFGSAFFMLSRYEEVVLPDRDNHDRFPATASTAYSENFLDRPIIDEYLEVLWAAMKLLWPDLKRKNHQGQVRVTCDVDVPYDCSSKLTKNLPRLLVGDVIRRRDVMLACARIKNYFASKRGDYSYDPYNTFQWYMDESEKAGRRASFYFIPDHTAGAIDGCYNINEERIHKLIRDIDERGHEVGVHGSYNSYQSSSQIQREKNLMQDACEQAGIKAHINGNRQHYLRWDVRHTPDYLDAAGYEYDTTGSFADLPGFRYGTSREFSMWSWQNNKSLRIKQKPLIVMECSVLAKRYMGLGYTDEAMSIMQKLKRRAMKYGGDFTLLWHNSSLTTDEDKIFFKELIS